MLGGGVYIERADVLCIEVKGFIVLLYLFFYFSVFILNIYFLFMLFLLSVACSLCLMYFIILTLVDF